MRILLTGASSFTGAAFIEALAAAGHEVTAPVRKGEADYADVRGDRVARIKRKAEIVWSTPFGSAAFLDLASRGSYDVFCHHAAQVTNYRSPEFDVVAALADNTANIRSVLTTLKNNGLRSVVLTGSVFEADEGLGEEPLRAFSPYGLSKTLTSQVVRYWCSALGLPLGKFVIPNPFGPFEEPRFCSYLFKTWRKGETPKVNTPDYIRDNIHVDLLAACYRGFVETGSTGPDFLRCGPSGYVESQGSFSRRMAREIGSRLGHDYDVDLGKQVDFSEPMMRINSDIGTKLSPTWDEGRAWDRYADYLQSLD